jgi:autotransporter-associated beta strand protein
VGSNGGTCFFLQSGGSVTAGSLGISPGDGEYGAYVQTGGTDTVTSIQIGGTVVTSGTYVLSSSAMLQTSGITGVAGSIPEAPANVNVLDLDGGTLQAQASSAAFIQGPLTVNVQSDAVFDTNGFDIGITVPLQHDTTAGAPALDGGLTEIGGGTLDLSASNDFTGGVAVFSGTLQASISGALAGTSQIAVESGATLLLSNTGNLINDAAAITLFGGTLKVSDTVSGIDEVMGDLFLNGSSTISFGLSSGNTLTAASLSYLSGTLSVFDWTGDPYLGGATLDPDTDLTQDRLLFTFDPGFSLGTVIPDIAFYDIDGQFIGDGEEVEYEPGGFEIVAVPEPSGLLLVASAIGIVLVLRSRPSKIRAESRKARTRRSAAG